MAKYTIGYYHVLKCEKCNDDLPLIKSSSLYFSENVFRLIRIGPKTSNCLNCGHPYKNLNQEYFELSKFERFLYLMGFVMVPDLRGINDLHSDKTGFFSFIFYYLFIFCFYWFYFLSANICMLCPLRIIFHLY